MMREVEVTVEPLDVFQRGARLPGGAHNNSLRKSLYKGISLSKYKGIP